jgi:hypothetical protein
MAMGYVRKPRVKGDRVIYPNSGGAIFLGSGAGATGLLVLGMSYLRADNVEAPDLLVMSAMGSGCCMRRCGFFRRAYGWTNLGFISGAGFNGPTSSGRMSGILTSGISGRA